MGDKGWVTERSADQDNRGDGCQKVKKEMKLVIGIDQENKIKREVTGQTVSQSVINQCITNPSTDVTEWDKDTLRK